MTDASPRTGGTGLRILFTFAGGNGHLEPLVPIARAAVAAGHEVAFAGRPWMVPRTEAMGFRAFATGTDTGGAPARRPLLELDQEREELDFRDGFVRRVARERTPDLLALGSTWSPDLVVAEETDYGALVAAERLGIPRAIVKVMGAGSFIRDELIAEPLAELRGEHGLPPDPQLVTLEQDLVLSSIPPSFRDPRSPLPPATQLFRSVASAGDGKQDTEHDLLLAPFLRRTAGRALVYFTLGTVFNMESGDLFARVIDGLRELPVGLIVTVGHAIDPAELGSQPEHVLVERYIPQARLLPRVDLVISHAGSGSVLGALAQGVPMVLIPMGADQPSNAARCQELGIARVLDPVRATPAMVRDAVSTVLEDPSYRRSVAPFQAEMAAMPEPAVAISRLERLVAERGRAGRPLRSPPRSPSASAARRLR